MRNSCGTASPLLLPSFIVLVYLLSAAPSRLLAEPTAYLVDDLATSRSGSVGVGQIAPVGSKVFFEGFEAGSGGELWVSDRTTNGTRLLLDLCPGPCSSGLQLFGGVGGVLIFAVTDRDTSDLRLWRSDGTRPGTFSLTESFGVAQQFGVPGVFFGGAFFFQACSGVRCELWRTDGSRQGTGPFLAAGEEPLEFYGEIVVATGRLFFVAGPFRELSLWMSDGTPAGTRSVRQFEFARFLTAAADRVYFTVQDGGETLWTSDGTTQGTYPVSNVFLTISPFQVFWREVSGNRIYFQGSDVHGEEIWMSDGSRSGARRVTDLADPEPFGSTRPRVLGERVIFTATDGSDYRLGSTTGDPASTTLLTIPCDFCEWHSIQLHAAQDRVFFILYDSPSGMEVWSSDGTAAGTRLLKDVCPGTCSSLSHQTYFFETPSGIVFTASDARGIANLWKSDGTPQGTQPLTSFEEPFLWPPGPAARVTGQSLLFFSQGPQGPTFWRSEGLREPQPIVTFGMASASSNPSELTRIGNRLFFTACDGTTRRLWQASGSAGAISPVLPEVSWFCLFPLPVPLIPVGPRLLLWANPGDRLSLWAIDETGGTTRILDGVNPQLSLDTAVAADRFYFRAPGQEGTQIWRTDGTPSGTSLAFTIPERVDQPLIAVGAELFFVTHGVDSSPQLWRSDGTAAGTRKIGPFGIHLLEEVEAERLGSRVFFVATFSNAPDGFWVTDGTSGGTVPLFAQDDRSAPIKVRELIVSGEALYFLAETQDGDHALWRSNGTASGTHLVHRLGSFLHPSPSDLTAVSGRLYFTAHDPEHGLELWISDGTEPGTRRLRDILPGPGSSAPDSLVAAGGKIYFAATDGAHGVELWQSDGTAEGTQLVQDIAPEASSSIPQDFKVSGGLLYFTADDGRTGRELWALPLTGPGGCQPSSTRLCLNGGRFQVEAAWRDFQGGTGQGTAVSLTGDTGYFWFFDPANAEVVLKILDGRGLNDHHWVFYGALSSVEYALTVTDTQTGLARRYLNPSGQLASVGDTQGFGPLGAHSATPEPLVALPSPPALVSARTVPAAATGSCQSSPRRLCLNGGRFAVEASWKDFQGNTGAGTAVSLTGDTGWFWFFDSSNVEVMLKVLDGTPLNGKFWVFYGALSNVEYTLTVTDTQTGAVKEYRNPSGRFASVADTAAF